MLKQFVLCVVVAISMICEEARGDFPFCDSGKFPCYSRWNGPNGPEGVCYNPSTQVCWPVSGGENVVCSFGETLCGKQCYKVGDGKVCWSYDTLCDQKQAPCIMSALKKGQCYDSFKETCFANVVCPNYQFPCSNDNTKCCGAGK
jgi:hypothetical protein